MNSISETFPESKFNTNRGEVDLSFENSQIDYVFDEQVIFDRAKLELEKLIQSKFPDPEVLALDLDINWSYLGEDNGQIIRHLVFTGGWEKLLEFVPAKIAFSEISSELFSVLEKLIRNGYGLEVLSRLEKVSSCDEIHDYMLGIFHELIAVGLADKVISWLPSYKHGDQLSNSWLELYQELSLTDNNYQRSLVEQLVIGLPVIIDFNEIDEDLVFKINLLLTIDKTFIQDVLNKITKKIDVLLIDPAKLALLKKLFESGYGDYLIEFIKPSTKKITFGYYSTSFLVYLIEKGYDQQVLPIINVAIGNGTKGGSFLDICEALVRKNHVDLVLSYQVLPDEIALGEHNFFRLENLMESLIDAGYGIEVVKRIKIDNLNNLTVFAQKLLIKLVKAGFITQVKALFPPNTNYVGLVKHVEKLVAVMASLDQQIHTEVLSKFPSTIELKKLRSYGFDFTNWIEEGFGEEIAKRFVGTSNFVIDFSYTYNEDESKVKFLVALARGGYSDLLQQMFADQLVIAESMSRQPINSKELLLTGKVGPHLDEIITNLPINLDTGVKKLRSGWYEFSLRKDGSSTKVFLLLKDNQFKVVFRNEKIAQDKLTNYQAAHQLMPGYISSANYPEIQSPVTAKKSKLKQQLDGFREVYAGVSLAALTYNLPDVIERSIIWQKKYILLKLAINGIDHGHAHDLNFNVRFLLEKNGEKQVFFDVNLAIRFAIEQQMTLTPIVTLRDWDAATSS